MNYPYSDSRIFLNEMGIDISELDIKFKTDMEGGFEI